MPKTKKPQHEQARRNQKKPTLEKQLAKVAIENMDRLLSEFVLGEDKAGRLAREALRARRDGDKERADKIIKPLFYSVAIAIVESTKIDKASLPTDPRTGELDLPWTLPAEWQDKNTHRGVDDSDVHIPPDKFADRISQRELSVLLDLDSIATTLGANLRRRLFIGAAVEPGELQIEADVEDRRFLDSFDAIESVRVSGTTLACGVSVDRVKTA